MRFLRQKALFQIAILLLSTVAFALFLSEPISADQSVCCEKTVSGDFCLFTDASQCDPSYNSAPQSCADTAFCKPVCCVDLEEGTCFDNVGAADCANSGNAVSYDASCSSVSSCQEGCCQLGGQCFLTTQDNCDYLTQLYSDNDRGDFSSSLTTESACLSQCQSADLGCCIASDRTCSYTSSSQCVTSGLENGDGTIGFYQNIYCTDSSLDCDCEPHARKGCLPGDDDVYWFDSCGNPEDIAEDCSYADGTLCKQHGDDAFCASINCEDTSKGNRGHGESWCRYEGRVGPTNDLVGSRHYRELCVNGDVLVEPCADFRDELCAEYLLDDGGIQSLRAECIPNEGVSCVEECSDPELSLDEQRTCCESKPSCYWIEEQFQGVCLPLSPPGLAFWDASDDDRSSDRDAKEICDRGDKTCVSVHVKTKPFGGYDCVANCECENPDWGNNVNTYCRALGDCGAHYNVAGDLSSDGARAYGARTFPFDPDLYEPFDTFWNVTDGSLFFGTVYFDPHDPYSFRYKPFFRVVRDNEEMGLATGISVILSSGLMVVAFVVIILLDYLTGGWLSRAMQKAVGIGKKKNYTHVFDCEPWVAPSGSSCVDCQKDFGEECTDYRCRSYGSTCELVNGGTNEAACVDKNPGDVKTPTISPWSDILSAGHSYELTSLGYHITDDDDTLVQPFTVLRFGIETDEYSQCKYSDLPGVPYDQMTTFFGTPSYSLYHNLTFFTLGSRDYSFHVKCSDARGNAHVRDYVIQFATSAEPDLTPPVLLFSEPDHNAYIASGAGSVDAILYFNEPLAACRYTTDHAGIPFDSMSEGTSELFICAESADDIDPRYHAFPCLVSLPVADALTTTHYIKCQDLAGNVNANDHEYTLVGTIALEISSFSPTGALFTRDVLLQVSTAHGADHGKAVCSLTGPFITQELDFFTTGGTIHTLTLQNLTLGDYAYTARCRDLAGNTDTVDISFQVDVDTYSPLLVAVYSEGTTLFIATDEPSSCRYSTDDATFAFDQGMVMSGDGTREHTLQDSASSLYVACRDASKNIMSTFTVYR